jgi:hypothetical protein
METLIGATTNMLSKEGGDLTLDDIGALRRALERNGAPPDALKGASREAFQGYVAQLPHTLRDLGSVDELDSYADELKGYLDEFGLLDNEIEHRIADRRKRLELDEIEAGFTDYVDGEPPITESSDEAIRSLFATLREN